MTLCCLTMDKAFQKPRLYESSVHQTLACSCLRQSTVFIISIQLAASFIMDTSFHQGCAQTCKSASGLALSGGCPYCSSISEHDLIFHRSCSFCFFAFPKAVPSHCGLWVWKRLLSCFSILCTCFLYPTRCDGEIPRGNDNEIVEDLDKVNYS